MSPYKSYDLTKHNIYNTNLKSAATGVDFLGVTPGADFVTLPPITNKGSGGSVLALGGLEAFFSGSLVVSLMVAGGLMG